MEQTLKTIQTSIDQFKKSDFANDESAAISLFIQQKQILEKKGVNQKNKIYKELCSLINDLIKDVVIEKMGEGEPAILFELTKIDAMLCDIKILEQIQSIIPFIVSRLGKSRGGELIQFERLEAWVDAILFVRLDRRDFVCQPERNGFPA